MSSFARGMPPTRVWPPQSHGNVQLLTHVESSSWRNRFQNWKAWPELQTGTEATHPNTTLHLKAPLGEGLAAHQGQVRSITFRSRPQVNTKPRATQ